MKLIDLKKKYQGHFLSYYVASYLNKDGDIKEYELISRNHNLDMSSFHMTKPQGVGMVCYSKDKTKILLQKEFRMATNEWVYNFSGGCIDEGESIEETAKRELKEETGLDLIEVVDVLPLSYSSQGTSDEVMSIVICTVDGEIKESCFADEEIEPVWLTKEEARKLLFEDKAIMSVRTQMYIYMWINS